MKTVLITGCSSGFGLDTARYFLERDWKVIATMRVVRESLLPRSEHLKVLPLDVTDPKSVWDAVAAAGPIDALVNNAGIGVLGPLEGMTMPTAREVFETNTLGTIAMTQAVIPQFRERQSGVIVNVTSTVTLRSLPLLAVYTASKAAVNAFTESLALELEPFNIRAKLVLPGRAPDTQFGANAQQRMQDAIPEAYGAFAQGIFEALRDTTGPITRSIDVAQAVWEVVNNPAAPMRTPAGADAVAWSKVG